MVLEEAQECYPAGVVRACRSDTVEEQEANLATLRTFVASRQQ